ncbi:hypothetical protein CAP39_05600 [Sphingomonas sp. IBVSS1]|nr:hypothetical protein CAP39_05600 [Sphingomonas sp. IBVSS1]
MTGLTAGQQQLLANVTAATTRVPGVAAVVLGGSHARGRARPDSDLDIGLLYRAAQPIDMPALRALAAALNDTPDPVVSDPGGWGRWVDGGAWLSIGGQRVDFLYRRIEQIEQVLADAQAGRFEIDTDQQPPYGFFGPTILGEISVAVPLHNPQGLVPALQALASPMPEALARAVVQDRLWQAQFTLSAFADKHAASANIYGVAGCATRIAHALVLALFALNRCYLLNDKTAVAEIAGFAMAPADFGPRLAAVLAAPGADASAQRTALAKLHDLFAETRALAGSLYRPPWDY